MGQFLGGDQKNLYIDAGIDIEVRECRFVGADVNFSTLGGLQGVRVVNCMIGPLAGMNMVGVDGAVVTGCTFIGNSVGLQYEQGASGLVQDCEFTGNYVVGFSATLYSDVLVRACQFMYVGQGAIVSDFGSRIAVEHCVVGGGSLAAVKLGVFSEADAYFRDNDFQNGGGFTVIADGPAEAHLDFTNNYWGTTDTEQIDEWIDDNADHHSYISATVDYLPIREQSIPVWVQSLGQLKALFQKK